MTDEISIEKHGKAIGMLYRYYGVLSKGKSPRRDTLGEQVHKRDKRNAWNGGTSDPDNKEIHKLLMLMGIAKRLGHKLRGTNE